MLILLGGLKSQSVFPPNQPPEETCRPKRKPTTSDRWCSPLIVIGHSLLDGLVQAWSIRLQKWHNPRAIGGAYYTTNDLSSITLTPLSVCQYPWKWWNISSTDVICNTYMIILVVVRFTSSHIFCFNSVYLRFQNSEILTAKLLQTSFFT